MLPRGRNDEERLTAEIIELTRQYRRYSYRKIAGLLRQAGCAINDRAYLATRGAQSPRQAAQAR